MISVAAKSSGVFSNNRVVLSISKKFQSSDSNSGLKKALPHKNLPKDVKMIVNSSDPKKAADVLDKHVLHQYIKSAKLSAIAHINTSDLNKGKSKVVLPKVPEKYDTFLKLDDFFDYKPGSNNNKVNNTLSRKDPYWAPDKQLLPNELFIEKKYSLTESKRKGEVGIIQEAKEAVSILAPDQQKFALKKHLRDIKLTESATKNNVSLSYIKRNLTEKTLSARKFINKKGSTKKATFWRLIAVGDGNGMVGIGIGRSKESGDIASVQGYINAVKNLQYIPRYENRTISNQVTAKKGACHLNLSPAPPGSGIKAAGIIYELCSLIGIKDIISKGFKGRNHLNTAVLLVDALKTKQRSIEELSMIRGRNIIDVKKAYFE
ncbi:hypothetical protein ACO0OE_000141 [Hanseniaspora uvarum]